MARRLLAVSCVLAAFVNACALDVDDPADENVGDVELEARPAGGGKACVWSGECRANQHCSIEDGDCFPDPACKPGEMCTALCYGTCVNTPDPCGGCGKGKSCQECKTIDGSVYVCIPAGSMC